MSNQTATMARWLHDNLKARKYPFRVVYAPERTKETGFGPMILFSRDHMASEKIESAHGTVKNGRKFRTRRLRPRWRILLQFKVRHA
jgi:hypothetical protein